MVIHLPDSIVATIHQFTGRAWLLPTLLTWLDQPEQHLFLIIGALGSGKSMVTAWLAGAGSIPVNSSTPPVCR